MPTLTCLSPADLRQAVLRFRDALRSHQGELNLLNVYPVPDGDTGTNMALTLESVCTEVGDATRMDDVCKAMAHGSLMGARGNSGVILSQILRGMADTFAPLEAVIAPAAVEAHQHGQPSSLRYEVMFLLDAEDPTISAFKETWSSIGDSIVVVGGEGVWNCHVHTNEIGAAIEAGIQAGHPHSIRVTDLVEQV